MIHYIRIADIATETKMHPQAIERLVYRRTLLPDATIQFGEGFMPIFRHDRLEAISEVIALERARKKQNTRERRFKAREGARQVNDSQTALKGP
jgi:hypothetical protein